MDGTWVMGIFVSKVYTEITQLQIRITLSVINKPGVSHKWARKSDLGYFHLQCERRFAATILKKEKKNILR